MIATKKELFSINRMLSILSMALFAIIILQRACIKDCVNTVTPKEFIHDTAFITDTKTISHTEFVYKRTVDTFKILDPKYIPDTNYQALKKQFLDLVVQHTSLAIYKDSLTCDTAGVKFKINITDSIQLNTLISATYSYNWKFPIVQVEKKKNQLYVGGELSLGKVQTAGLGILLKNKRNQIYGVNVFYIPTWGFSYGLSTYIKL